MFNLVVVPNNSGNFGVGHFRTLEAARTAQHNIHERLKLSDSTSPVSVTIEDDYGTILDIPARNISYIAIIDVQKKSAAAIEAKVFEAKANMEFQQRLMQDRELQVLHRFMQSQQPQPPVIHVNPNGSGTPSESPQPS